MRFLGVLCFICFFYAVPVAFSFTLHQERQPGMQGARDVLSNVGENVDPSVYRHGTGRTHIQDFVSLVINIALGFVGTLLLIVIIYGGYTWLMAGGNQEKVSYSLKLIRNALIGFVLVSLAWMITAGVLKLMQIQSS